MFFFIYSVCFARLSFQQSPTLEWRTFTTAETRILSLPVHVGFVQGKVTVGEVSLQLHSTLVLHSTCLPEKVGVNKK